MNKIANLNNNLELLSLSRMKEIVNEVIDKTVKNDNYTILDALLELTNSEIAFRNERASKDKYYS